MASVTLLEGIEAERWVASRAAVAADDDARAAVGPILAAVRRRGDAALRELTQRLDGVSISTFRARRADLRAALAKLPARRRSALEMARANLERFHRAQLREERRLDIRPGVTVWREFRPIERVGIYVPGGRAGYPSSLLMCGVPARLAGCPEIAVCVPPGPDGRAPEPVLAAAEMLGIDNVFAVGGAQAIAALAFGTESVPRVDKIFGPGNRYVTLAKELVFGSVDIDMAAGPSEIVVLADESADPLWLAADLLSQAEHSADALVVCITTGAETARRVRDELTLQVAALPDACVARESLARSAVCLAADLDRAIRWANLLAPEHLSIVTRDDEAVLRRIRHAGSVFLGPYSPVAAGDYAVGSNHVLPTGRRARARAALSVEDFGRWMQVQRVTAQGLHGLAESVASLARWEGFEAHARAVEVRFREAR